MAEPIVAGANPLTEEHFVALNRGLAAAEEGLRQIALARQAGIDVGTKEKDIRDAMDRMLAIKQVYFPGR